MVLKVSSIFTKPFINHIKYHRVPHIQKEYDNYLIYLEKNNITIKEYIINHIIKDNIMNFCKNQFPYDIKEVNHYLLWINPKYKISYETIYNYLQLLLKGKMYIYFENSEVNKSVDSITHYHVLINYV